VPGIVTKPFSVGSIGALSTRWDGDSLSFDVGGGVYGVAAEVGSGRAATGALVALVDWAWALQHVAAKMATSERLMVSPAHRQWLPAGVAVERSRSPLALISREQPVRSACAASLPINAWSTAQAAM